MVASYTQLLAKRYKGRLDSDADEFIAYAVDGCNRMQGLIQDLLAYSRAGTNGKALRKISGDDALKEALTNLRRTIGESGAVVTHDPLPVIQTDDTRLTQVFQNLVGNAIKYRSAEVPRVHVSARKNGGPGWIFSVRDNGLGIDPQYFERIFILSSGCTGETSSRALESDWPFARRFWSGWAAGSGSSRNPERAQPSTLPCQKERTNDEIDWNGRGTY